MFARNFFSPTFYAGNYFAGTGGEVTPLTPSVIFLARTRDLVLDARSRPMILRAKANP